MLRNNKGYLLLEAMLSLMLITAVCSICLPFIYVSYQEQKTSKELLYAMTEADLAAANKGENKELHTEKEWIQEGVRYQLTKKGVADEYETCITFKGSNDKEYITCASSN
jgi:type II secretory pathway pseudopilin PulG